MTVATTVRALLGAQHSEEVCKCGSGRSPAARQRTATLVLPRNQSPLEEVEPFLHGIDRFTKLPDCRIRGSNNRRVTFKPLGESARKANNDHANRNGRDDRDDRDSWLHR